LQEARRLPRKAHGDHQAPLYAVPFATRIGLDHAQRNGQPNVLNADGAMVMHGSRRHRFMPIK
jgi:hypothetical protein